MSLLRDAVGAMKIVLLLEERILSQSRQLEQLAGRMVEMDRRLAMTEGRLEGFLAAFAGGGQTTARQGVGARLIEGSGEG